MKKDTWFRSVNISGYAWDAKCVNAFAPKAVLQSLRKTERTDKMRKEIRICGAGGQGVILLSVILAHAYGIYGGMEVAQSQAYGPEARGGACYADLVVSDQPISYIHVHKADTLVAMNQPSYRKFESSLSETASVFVDSSFFDMIPDGALSLSATEIAQKTLKPFVANIVMLGFITAHMPDLSIESVEKALKDNVPEKSFELNRKALYAGYKMGNDDATL